MRIGAGIFEHSDGRFEARYRKGRRPDGSIIYGSVYGRTYQEAEKRRAELLQQLALKAENAESQEAVELSEINKNIRRYYARLPKNTFPEPLTEEEVEKLLPCIEKLYPGLRVAACLSLYAGLSSEELGALRWSDIYPSERELVVSQVMRDAKHMPGHISPCDARRIPIPDVVYDFLDLPKYVRMGEDGYVLGERGEHVKSLRSQQNIWAKVVPLCGYEGRINPEILRATFIRRAFERGINAETVARITGITSLVLQRKYGHFSGANISLLRDLDDSSLLQKSNARQMNLLILGAGSHGHAVYEIAEKMGVFQKISFLDDNRVGEDVIGVLDDCIIFKDEYPACFIAIGDNEKRKELAERVTKAGFITPRLISTETSIARGASIGRGTIVMPQATINSGAEIGEFCIIASNTLIGFNAVVENFAHCDCASVVMKDCVIPTLATVESGEVIKAIAK